MSDIILMKLVSGEEIIAKCEPQAPEFTVSNPVILIPNDNTGQLGFVPWTVFADLGENGKNAKYVFNMQHVMAYAPAHVGMAQAYRKEYGEIQIVTPKLITS